MSRQEMPIFTRTFELLSWLLPVSNHFPRAHRFTITQRLLHKALDLNEQLQAADLRRGEERRERLLQADESLAQLRFYLRLTHRLGWLSSGQYEHVAKMLVEIGRLLGGWLKSA